MNHILLIVSFIILLCILLKLITSKIGVPVLLAFILLGMVFGSEGIFKIRFDDFKQAETICSFALIFIMFYGGFGTNIKGRSGAYFNVCGYVCLLCPEIFMDKLDTYRCCDFFNRCGKCILHITRQTFES